MMIDFNFAPFSNDADLQRSPAYLDLLNDRQREAALITEGPLIVLAGAGSGKTKMLTTRIAHLVDSRNVSPHEILAVTFTNKAAAEMRERVERLLNSSRGNRLGVPEIGTFHSVCVRILRREAGRTPFTKPFVIYDDADQLSLIKAALNKLGMDDKIFNPKALQSSINRMKCDALEPEDLQPSPHQVFERQLKRVYEAYQKDLFANNALDFGEIICLTYRLLRDHPDIRGRYQRRFRYVHVDEYQDTNRSQYLLLSILAGIPSGGHGNICVVGDEDQSIYKWRGADIRNILDFERDFEGARVVKLEQNYRSSQTIIRAAAEVIKNNRSRKTKTLWTANAEGVPIVRTQLQDDRAEAEMVVGEIKRLASIQNRTFSEFAVFYRTNAQSRQFEDVFRREKIPYQIVGGLRFYDRKEIKDILAYLKVILNPTDSVNLKRIINVPARGIGKTTLEKLDEIVEAPSYWAVLERAVSDPSITSPAAATKISKFVGLIQRLIAEQPKLLLSELYHLILDETGYVRGLRQEGTEEALARIANLEELDNLLQEFEGEQLGDGARPDREELVPQLLPIFIEQSSLASDHDQLDIEAGSVKMMTLHSSKGLEFPVVFMVGMEEGLFPSIKPWEENSEEDIEEERRLCYVGMTRAREILYMANAIARRIWGNIVYQEASRFFSEIPSHLIEFTDYSAKTRLGFGSQSNALDQNLVGRGLNHPEYGFGQVISVEGEGDQQKVSIQFRGFFQPRKFLFRFIRGYLDQ